jgi:hypothetical protein
MRTLDEIQDAVLKLTDDERKELLAFLVSKSDPDLTEEEEQHLSRALNATKSSPDSSAN